MALTTLDGVIVDPNPALCEMLRVPRKELIGTPLEYLKFKWKALGMVALPEGFIRHLPVITGVLLVVLMRSTAAINSDSSAPK